MPGSGADDVADNPLNAWIPEDVRFTERDVSLLWSFDISFFSASQLNQRSGLIIFFTKSDDEKLTRVLFRLFSF